MTTDRTPARSGSRRLCRRALSLFLSCLFTTLALLGAILPASALEDPPASTDVGVVLLLNLENNLTLYEKEADTNVYPSSSVKIMTGLLACRALADRLDETVTVSAAMVAGVTGRSMHLADGEKLTVKDLLYAAICGGYNDAACVLACLASGSVAAFVEDMNEEALRIGALHTRYTNPTGLHDPAMCTTARDIAIIAREAYANDLYMRISSERTYTVPATNVSSERLFSNRNALISDSSQNYYNGRCKGMNAGMTDEGGWCVVTVYEASDGAANLCIILRGLDVASGELIPAYVQTNRLLSWANRNYGYRTVLAAGDTLDTVRVGMTGISKSKADLVPAEDLKIYLPEDLDVEGQLEFNAILDGGELTAPIAAGQTVGTVTVSYGGRIVGKAPLTVTEDFQRSGFLGALQAFKGYLTGRAFLLTIPIFLVMLLPYLYATGSSGGRYGLRTVRRRRRIRYTKRHF
ncbi:MAG: D-alanyl-D-alanine carboxypeptidase [Clostridia bacterium]|nr:D-alanyl-D-alanine carboxypeptidase [Clostridia bacterium]